jgi:hypothetical protein
MKYEWLVQPVKRVTTAHKFAVDAPQSVCNLVVNHETLIPAHEKDRRCGSCLRHEENSKKKPKDEG